eukprot:gene14596-16104_t
MIVEKLQKQLKPQKSALVACYEFDNRARNHGESVSEYVAVLKHLATECKFSESMRVERLRDRIMSGIRDKQMMTDLFKMKLEELTFEVAVDRCIAIEQSYRDVEALQGGMETNSSVNMLTHHKQRPRATKSSQPGHNYGCPDPTISRTTYWYSFGKNFEDPIKIQ